MSQLGRIGRMAKTHWKAYCPKMYQRLVKEGKLNQRLLAVEKEAEDQIELIRSRTVAKMKFPDDPLEKAGQMRMVRLMAEETVLRDLVLFPPEKEVLDRERRRNS